MVASTWASQRQLEWRRKNPAAYQAVLARRKAAGKFAAYQKAWTEANREKRRAAYKRYYDSHCEQRVAAAREYRAKNIERLRKQQAAHKRELRRKGVD